MQSKLDICLADIRKKVNFKPEIAIVLGSGLGDYGDSIYIEDSIEYSNIEGFPISTVEGHKGRFIFGYVENRKVVIMQGRVHYYEGYSMSDVVLPIRLMGKMGADKILLTNAAGGCNPAFNAGDFMMITDHIAVGVPSPLIGPNMDELGPRFPDMSEVYSKRVQNIIKYCAEKSNIPLQKGVYIQFSGPNYETPAEVKMAQILGGDAIGMSTACEAIAAYHMGMEIGAISCITNMAAGISNQKLSHKEVQETADLVSRSFWELVTKIIIKM